MPILTNDNFKKKVEELQQIQNSQTQSLSDFREESLLEEQKLEEQFQAERQVILDCNIEELIKQEESALTEAKRQAEKDFKSQQKAIREELSLQKDQFRIKLNSSLKEAAAPILKNNKDLSTKKNQDLKALQEGEQSIRDYILAQQSYINKVTGEAEHARKVYGRVSNLNSESVNLSPVKNPEELKAYFQEQITKLKANEITFRNGFMVSLFILLPPRLCGIMSFIASSVILFVVHKSNYPAEDFTSLAITLYGISLLPLPFYFISKKAVKESLFQFIKAYLHVTELKKAGFLWIDQYFLNENKRIKDYHTNAELKNKQEIEAFKTKLENDQEEELELIKHKSQDSLIELNHQHEEKLKTIIEKHTSKISAYQDKELVTLDSLSEQYDKKTAESKALNSEKEQKLTDHFNKLKNDEINSLKAIIEKTDQYIEAELHSWDKEETLAIKDSFPREVTFGVCQIDLLHYMYDLNETLAGQSLIADIPIQLNFPEKASLYIESDPKNHANAIDVIQNICMRLLSDFPPAKVCFDLVDPVGLGQNFSAFTHLSDFDSSLIGERILSATKDIEQRLSDLCEHMEKMIQKYLRNEYNNIFDYNEKAAELSEKLHFLVLMDFPTGLSEKATKHLNSIISSGPRCGVYTIILKDIRHELPENLDKEQLFKQSLAFSFTGKSKTWRAQEHHASRPSFQTPPQEESRQTEILKKIGENAVAHSRVEVDFFNLQPQDDQLWNANTDAGLEIPIGLSGRKTQMLSFGKGTNQHALIAGKTGSGKSTLMHVIIASAINKYSPDELRLYLIDFKKGVEFKTYADAKLPHAEVIAIESDREFGLSVLRKLDHELNQRGQIFRQNQVQDLASFKKLENGEAMPRIIFMVDEFQEIFTEDDQVSQEASLLLDRLIRQGRAFGLHVILGSQPLGGAYSLPRTTISQMTIRLALQCSEQDSYLILNEDNPAARLLSRPGDGIYNDTAGNIEGNSPFQVLWISEEQRQTVLTKLKEKAENSDLKLDRKIFCFEGNLPAKFENNVEAQAFLKKENTAKVPTIFFGEPNAIKSETRLSFPTQSGRNLLIIGQNSETALALQTLALITLKAQQPEARFYILDGAPADFPQKEILAQTVEELNKGSHKTCHMLEYRDIEASLSSLKSELDQAIEQRSTVTPTYFIVFQGQRIRALRNEDDFDFSFDDTPKANPAKDFAEILEKGPEHGWHTLFYCVSENSLNRTLNRKSLREFEPRVLFQMSQNDSLSLIDSPDASQLGLYTALYCNEQEGELEKFRPYALPALDQIQAWLGKSTVNI